MFVHVGFLVSRKSEEKEIQHFQFNAAQEFSIKDGRPLLADSECIFKIGRIV